MLCPTHPTTQLMQLRQPKTIGVVDHHDRGIGYVDPNFNHRGRYQNLKLVFAKSPHRCLLLLSRETTMQQTNTKIRKMLLQLHMQIDRILHIKLLRFFDQRTDHICLSAEQYLTMDKSQYALKHAML